MLHVMSMYRPGDLRQTAVSDLSKVNSMSGEAEVWSAKQHNHSAIAAWSEMGGLGVLVLRNLVWSQFKGIISKQ
jgi:hypothetical protein